jgi:S-adenosylmethionine-dependent methyltransferase
MHQAKEFDSKLAAFKEHQATPWGQLRYRISQALLQPHLPDGPLRILDAGGGNGFEALHYAAQGHTVALHDLSAAMLADARWAADVAGLGGRLSCHEGSLADIPALFPEPQFDLVLCHNVLQYIDDLEGSIQALCHPLVPGGMASIICVNAYSEPYRKALMELDLDAAYAALSADTIIAGVFSLPVHARLAEDLYDPLEAAGCTVVARYGVRCVSDYIYENELKSDPEFAARLERLELAVAALYPYYLLARFFLLVARKEAS